jgi:pyruvate dehydrogenase E2 component (dihydrolipoamide acetyltransferase)
MMPKGSDTMTEGKVLKWLKNEGDAISTGDTVVEIETDKVDMEVEAMGSGVLRKILVQPGKVVPVGELLAVIAKADEDIAALVKPDGAAKAEASSHAPSVVGAGASAALSPQPPAPSPAPVADGRLLASPLAKRMAKEMGFEIAEISGSGPNGRIIRQDVERQAALARVLASPLGKRMAKGMGLETTGIAGAGLSGVARYDAEHHAAPAPAPPAAVGGTASVPTPHPAPVPLPARRPAVAPTGPEFSDQPLSSMRKIIATRLVQSKAPVPHFYLTVEVNMHRAKELRESANLLDPELKLSYNAIILKACAAALRQNPEVNASFQGESIRYHHRIHLGMAVATEGGGLITPVLRNADTKSLEEISRESKELATRARARKLLPDEYAGSTFSISNLGMMGIDEFAAVINPPEGAILAVGAVAEKALVVNGRVEAGLSCRLTLSCDHRVVDGATGAKFLQSLKQILENPVYLAF